MIYWTIAVVGALASVLFGARRLSLKGGSSAGDLPNARDQELLRLDEKRLLAMLDRIRVAEEPEPVMGAMCYEPVAMPQVAEYVCPVCGEKTAYHGSAAQLVEFDLPEARRVMAEMAEVAGLELQLDERDFCAACAPDSDEVPEMLLRVRYEDGTEQVSAVSVTDLRMLRGFLDGRLYYLTFNDAQRPLKPHIPRLRELLGLPAEE